VTLNTGAPGGVPAADGRRRLAEALINELLSWNPREFISAFRRWHRDSISLIHLNVLTVLDGDGPDSMGHLAEALDVSVASMSGIVDRMEKRGLVERRHEGKDRRVVVVHPTEAGLDVFREIDRRRRDGLTQLIGQLSDDELRGLLVGHRALREARAAISALGEPGTTGGPAESASPTPAAPPRLHTPPTIPLDDGTIEAHPGPGA
jgi:DNA-binding MarR family transcriptional regulator